jgi:hypothetical protein
LSGNGNGFKGGGYGLPPTNVPAKPPQHIIRCCVAFLNRSSGFYQNHHPAACYWYNNTGFNNKSANFNMQSIELSGTDYTSVGKGILRNNISFTGNMGYMTGSGIDAANNSWNLSTITLSAADFQSIDTAGIYGPRKADGSLPDVKFLKLAAGSDLIDKGADVGLPFSGAAPDLGAYETGGTFIFRQPSQKFPAPSTISGDNDLHPTFIYDLSGRKILSGFTTGSHASFVFAMKPICIGTLHCKIHR